MKEIGVHFLDVGTKAQVSKHIVLPLPHLEKDCLGNDGLIEWPTVSLCANFCWNPFGK